MVTLPGTLLMVEYYLLVENTVEILLNYLMMRVDQKNCSNSNMKASMITIVLYDYINISHSDACLINEGNSFLLTGGYNSPAVSTVSRYDINGWVKDLNNLNTARMYKIYQQSGNKREL